MAKFGEATAVEGRDGRYAAELDPEWTIGGNLHGGYLLATMARAAVAGEPGGDHPHPLSSSATFLKSPQPGPATIEVESLRSGRTASQVRARLVQDGRSFVEALFTLGRLDPTVRHRWVDAPPADVAPESECRRSPVQPREGFRLAMLDMIEQRLDPASFRAPGAPPSVEPSPLGGSALDSTPGALGGPPDLIQGDDIEGGSGEIRGWLRFVDGTTFDPVSLLYAADGFPPSTFTLGSVGWVPTLELTVYVRAIPAPGALRVRQRARVLSGSFVDQVCEIWDEQGHVVAQATQLAAVRMRS